MVDALLVYLKSLQKSNWSWMILYLQAHNFTESFSCSGTRKVKETRICCFQPFFESHCSFKIFCLAQTQSLQLCVGWHQACSAESSRGLASARLGLWPVIISLSKAAERLHHVSVIVFFFGKVQFSPSNYRTSLIFNLQLRNQTTLAIQLSKLDKFIPWGGFEGGFAFYKINK